MKATLVTGSGGLVGSAAVDEFVDRCDLVVGVDNNMREEFFGGDASIADTVVSLSERWGDRYEHRSLDVRNRTAVEELIETYGSDVSVVIHAAAQPSHDWAASFPRRDFSTNAVGTFNLLEAVRRHAEDATVVFASTSKVYGDKVNRLPLVERETRWELPGEHPQYDGITEDFGVDQRLHSLFGASKLSADLVAQEYGRYYGLDVGIFRSGCVTGARHAGVEEHGFLSHLVKTIVRGETYTIFGYSGKQVRDNIHATDLARAFSAYINRPKSGEVYNIGGGRRSNCSVIEAIAAVEERIGESAATEYQAKHRKGDHKWYISDCSKFKTDYPEWTPEFDMDDIFDDLVESAVPTERVRGTL